MKTKHYLLLFFCIGLGAFSAVKAQYTAIPNAAFEDFLAPYDDIPNDGQVPTANIEILTSLQINTFPFNPNLTDITGIEDFRDLENVQFSFAPIPTIDLSNNLKLKTVIINSGLANSITLGSKPDLTSLDIVDSDISSIDVTGLPNVEYLRFNSSKLTSIDLSVNTILTELIVSRNQITSIDLSNNPLLTLIDFTRNQLPNIDLSSNPLLENINLNDNLLTTLDVSNNPALDVLQFNDNQIGTINLGNNPSLRVINADRTKVESINISQNPLCEYVIMRDGELANARLDNGNNANFTQMLLTGNPSLSCIQVDDPINIPTGWQKDAAANYSDDCGPFVTITGNIPNLLTGSSSSTRVLTVEFSSSVTGFNSVQQDLIGVNTGFLSITAVSSTTYEVSYLPNSPFCGDDVTIQIPSGAAQDTNTGTDNVASTVIVIPTADTVNPTANTQDITIQLDGNGQASITANDINLGSNDSCGGTPTTNNVTLSIDNANFECTSLGANTVTLTVTDLSGNVSTATATVTVEDNLAPIALAQDITIQLAANGQVTVAGTDVDNGSSDNCSVALSLSQSTFDCTDLGANTVTLTVTDPFGNTDTATAVVTVEDNTPLTAIAQDITVQLDANGQTTITPQDVDNGSGSGCGNITLTLDLDTFDCSNLGTNTVTLAATEGPNTATTTAIVTVEDTVPPTLIAQDITVALDSNGQVTIDPINSNIASTLTDNCGTISSITVTPASFNCGNIGTEQVVVEATDASGNTSFDISTVTIVDNIAPTAITRDITVQLNASGNVNITTQQINNGSFDNCFFPVISLDKTDFTCSDLGQNTVTLTATDTSGNTDTATAVVTIEDNQPLTAIAQDITVQLDANGQATITPQDVDNGSGSGCGNITLSLDVDTFDCTDIGTNTVTLTVTEGPNTETATAIVTVEDTVLPTVVTQDISIQLDTNGQATITTADIDNGSSDNCGIATQTLDVTSFDCSNIGANTVTLTVTDNEGNIGTGTAVVTVSETVAPIAITQDLTVQLDANGQASIAAGQIDNGSSDNCAIANLSLGQTDFSCTDVGTNTVTLTVADASGNTATATAVVTVEDNSVPTTTAQDITIQLDANGSVTIQAADLDNGSTDNCTLTFTADTTTFDCSNLGTNIVTLTATDGAGNSSTATATVTVEDTLAPIVTTQDITVTLDTNGDGTIMPVDIDNGSSDNCTAMADLTYSLDTTTFDCSNLGSNTVSLTVTDAEGNTANGTAIVTVTEDRAPTVVTQDITVSLDANGQASITAADIDNGSTDDCSGIESRSLDITNFDCPGLGDVTVMLTVTDNEGNTATGTATVTITATDEDNNGIADDCESRAIVTPQGFSPNGDSINDTWVIENIDDFPNNTVTVYNRWGQKVFEASNYQNDWDGISSEAGGSKRLPAGSYLYVIELNDADFPPKQGWIYINY